MTALLIVAGYLAVGLLVAWCCWRWPTELIAPDNWWWIAWIVGLWWAFVFIACMERLGDADWSIPTHAEWQERRRLAAERRARPSEVVPGGKR